MDTNKLSNKARLLHLSALSLANGMKSGSFKSLYRGHGIEFDGVREYLPGDDVRSIDWNVTARMGHPYVKMYEEERELDVLVILDVSESMNSYSENKSKLQTALEAATLITLASYHNSSPVGCVIFDGQIKFSCPPRPGLNQTMLLLSNFEKNEAPLKNEQTKGSVLDNAIRGASRLLKKRSLVMIFSDFRTASWTEPFDALCQKNDVVCVRLIDAFDENLPDIGSIRFCDPETGITQVLPTSSSKFKSQWRDNNFNKVELWKHECLRRGGLPLLLKTSADPLAELTRFFAAREVQ